MKAESTGPDPVRASGPDRPPSRAAGTKLKGPLPWILARRFLAGSRSRLLVGTARAALAATALGVAAMVIAMALMTGYSHDLQRKLIGENAAVGAYPLDPDAAELSPERLAELSEIDQVQAVSAVAFGRGLVSADDPAAAVNVTLRGVEPGAARPPGAELLISAGDLEAAVLGSELARSLGVVEGDRVRLTALGFGDDRPRFRYASLEVVGTFSTGVADYDGSWMIVDRKLVLRLTGSGPGNVLYEFSLDDPAAATDVSRAAEETLGSDFLVTDWRYLNRELFAALKLQKTVLFLALGLIVLVSTFNVASALMVLVRERMRDIGTLSAMGLSRRGLAWAFLASGLLLGGVGTAVGVVIGSGLCWAITEFELIRFPPEVAAVYFIDSVPFRVAGLDILAIVAFSLALTVLASLMPALRAGRIQPASAIRYE